MPAYTNLTAVALTQGVRELGNAKRRFIAGKYFPERPNNKHLQSILVFGEIASSARVSKYVKPGQGAVPVNLLAGSSKSVKIPGIRDKFSLNEETLGTLNPGLPSWAMEQTDLNAQLMETIALNQAQLADTVENTKELQALQALLTGVITITFADGDEAEIDFGYSSGSTYDKQIQTALSGDDLWTSALSHPMKVLHTLARYIRQHSSYAGGFDVIFGNDAWNAFYVHDDVKTQINNFFRYPGNAQLITGEGEQFRGSIDGFNFYSYEYGYVTAAGVYTQMMPANKIMMLPRDPGGNMSTEYGAVWESPDANTAPGWIMTDYFSKSVTHSDPVGQDIIVESRPLCVLRNSRVVRVQQVVA